MRPFYIVAVLAFLVATCSSTPPVIPTKNLEHPPDMTFVCLGLTSDGLLSGQRMDACHSRDLPDPTVTSNGQRILGTFAFIASPGRNELAVADMDISRLIDLTPDAPGYGMLPVGENPQAIASTKDGCWVATANRTSCDFSLIDPAWLLTATFSTSSSPATPATQTGYASRRIRVKTPAGTVLRAELGEIAFLPPASFSNVPSSDVTSPLNNCSTDDATRPRAVVTFPTCDMVALLEFSFDNASATIVNAFYVRPDLPGGFAAAGTEPVCPSDCGAVSEADGGTSLGSDAGTEVVDGGGASGAGMDGGTGGQETAWYLQPLALLPDGSRVYVGSLFDTAITSLDISAAGLGNPVRFSLAENPVGVSRLRLGVDPYRTTQVPGAEDTTTIVQGQFLQNRGAFLYAFTSDDSIRVVKLADSQEPLKQATPIECDVNIIATSDQDKVNGCLPVGKIPRRPLAQGPGIHIPIPFTNSPDSPPPLPRDISFADLQPIANDANYQSLSGQFGFVVASNGKVYVLNLAPNGEDVTFKAPDNETVPATATHSFREDRDVGKWARTPLAISIAPQRSVILSDQAFPTMATFSALEGPRIQSFSTDNGTTTNWLDFPDPDYIISRSWDVVWEGVLPQTSRVSGIVQAAMDGHSVGVLSDAGANFCTSGVQSGDVLMFSGCTQNLDCQPDDKFTCQVAVSGARGMCLPKDTTSSSAIISKCGRFMGSRMRYEIAQATPTSLTLQLKLDEVPKTKLNLCKQDSDCRPDVDHGKLAGATPDSGVKPGFECVPQVYDKDMDPRCVKKCQFDSDCRTGHLCETVPGTLPSVGKLCVEAPPIDPGCFPQPMTSYSARAGHAFMVYGSSMPSISTTRVSAAGICEPLLAADPSLVSRIPLSAPQCPNDGFLNLAHPATTDPITEKPIPAVFVQNLSAQSSINPCIYQGSHLDDDTTEGVGVGSPDDQRIRAFFQNPQIRFVLTNLDEYAGDLLQIHFELQYGFVPLTVSIPYEVMMTMGTRIITGPTKTPESPIRQHTPPTDLISYPYLYVVDQGRTALTPGSHGQVLRINPRAGSNEIASFDTTLSGSTPFQIQ